MSTTLPRSTCIEVAKLAGVSQATVSRVFTGRAPVSERTRRRILDAASQLGYRPNPLASGLRGSPTRTLGIAWSLSGPHDSEGMVRRLALKGHARGHATHVADHLSDPAVLMPLVTDFADRGIDALVIYDARGNLWDELAKAGLIERIPRWVVATQNAEAFAHLEDPRVSVIEQTRDAAMRQIAHYLAYTGRKDPAFLGPLQSNLNKAQPFEAQWQLEGLSRNALQILSCERPDSQGFYDALVRAFSKGRQPAFDALLCSTDHGAMAAHAFLRERGLRVPQDVALIGFNNSEFGQWCDPPLASVHRRDEELTDAIDQWLFSTDPAPSSNRIVLKLPMQFVWRESAGPICPEETGFTRPAVPASALNSQTSFPCPTFSAP